jgi:hypothetical protein
MDCKCGCRAAVKPGRTFVDKEHQLEWMLAGGGRELNALQPFEAKQRGGKVAGDLGVSTGQLAEKAKAGGRRAALQGDRRRVPAAGEPSSTSDDRIRPRVLGAQFLGAAEHRDGFQTAQTLVGAACRGEHEVTARLWSVRGRIRSRCSLNVDWHAHAAADPEGSKRAPQPQRWEGSMAGRRLAHTEVRKMVRNAAEAGAINLELPMGKFLDSVASGLPDDPGGELAIHVLCCNEYVLVTGLTGGPLEAVRTSAADIRSSLE